MGDNMIAEDASLVPRKRWVPFTCNICERTIWIPPSRVKRRKQCCRKCSDIALSKSMTGKFGKDAQYFKNGWHIDKKGYKQILISSPKSVKGNYRYKGEHLLKGESALERHLKKGECVHHIDCDVSNNNNNNLLVCNRGFHSWLHWEMSRRYAQEHLGGGYHRRSA